MKIVLMEIFSYQESEEKIWDRYGSYICIHDLDIHFLFLSLAT